MVPKFSRNPAASLAAIPSATRTRARSNPYSFAATAADPSAPHRAASVKSVFIVPRCDRLGDLTLHLHADVVGQKQIPARHRFAFGQSQSRRKRRHRRVRQQTVDPVLGDRELGVIVVIGMDSNRIGERGKSGCGLQGCASEGRSNHRRHPTRDSIRFEIGLHEFAGLSHRSAQGQSQAVQNRFPGQFKDLGRHLRVACIHNEVSDIRSYRLGLADRRRPASRRAPANRSRFRAWPPWSDLVWSSKCSPSSNASG